MILATNIKEFLTSKMNRYIKCILTICCKEVDKTATQEHIKPLRLTFTSVTVQTPTPITTTITDIFTSLE